MLKQILDPYDKDKRITQVHKNGKSAPVP